MFLAGIAMLNDLRQPVQPLPRLECEIVWYFDMICTNVGVKQLKIIFLPKFSKNTCRGWLDRT
jgi:hypothetical protein